MPKHLGHIRDATGLGLGTGGPVGTEKHLSDMVLVLSVVPVCHWPLTTIVDHFR